MQAIMETLFDLVYLSLVLVLGIRMLLWGGRVRQYRLYGIMAVILGAGDAFHLVPRAVALCTTGLSHYTAALGIGKLITSVTMTAFYVLLYYVLRARYGVTERPKLTAAVFCLAGLRVILCAFPQNGWTSPDPPLLWGILRNIPFAALGILLIVLCYRWAKEHRDRAFRFLWLTIVLSFAFYLPVVLFSEKFPLVGALMIPKTCAYVWTVWIGFSDMKRSLKK